MEKVVEEKLNMGQKKGPRVFLFDRDECLVSYLSSPDRLDWIHVDDRYPYMFLSDIESYVLSNRTRRRPSLRSWILRRGGSWKCGTFKCKLNIGMVSA